MLPRAIRPNASARRNFAILENLLLHTVNKSPHDKSTLISCLRLAQAGCDILLIEDGVFAAVTGSEFEATMKAAISRHQVYVLEPDLQCRGLFKSRLIAGIEAVDYDGFVELAVKNNSVHCWF